MLQRRNKVENKMRKTTSASAQERTDHHHHFVGHGKAYFFNSLEIHGKKKELHCLCRRHHVGE